MLSEVDLHVATFSESSPTALVEAHERPLIPISFTVLDSDDFAHRLWDSFETFLSGQVFIIIRTHLIMHLFHDLIFGLIFCLVYWIIFLVDFRNFDRDYTPIRIISFCLVIIGN